MGVRRLGTCCLLATLIGPVALSVSVYGQAQVANGIIEGLVRDASGAVVPGVQVEVRNKDTGFTRSLVTNEAGRYSALLLPVGTYEITAQLAGFATMNISDVLVQVGQQRVVDVVMRISAQTETVTVRADEVPLIETTRVNSSVMLDDKAVHELPTLARNFQTFTLLTPGTLLSNRTGTEANFSIAGQKGIHSTFTVDGAEYTNSFFGGQTGGDRPPFTVSLEAIKEFVVLSNGFNAEFGRSGGGVVNAVTKSGTNQFHGNGFWFFQDKSMVRDDAFGRPPLGRRQQFGATFGGPTRRDKLFFFVATDNQRRYSPINLVFNGQAILQEARNSSNPDRRAAAEFILGKQQQIKAGDNVRSLLGKVDWVANTSNNLSVRYNTARNSQPNGTYGLLPQRAFAPERFGLEKNDVDSFNTQLSTILTLRMVNEFRFNVNREDRPRLEPQISGTVAKNATRGGAQADILQIGNLGPPAFLPIGSLEWRYQVTDNLSYSLGTHDLKFGTDINLVSFDNLFRGGAPGQFTFFTFDSFVAKQPDQYFQFFGSGQIVTHPKYIAAYVQDSFKPRPGLTVNYGLRWESQIGPENDLPNTNFLEGTRKIPNDMHQWSPRLGIAWNPKNDGKSVVRFFGAYLYAPVPTLIWANVLRQNGDVSNGLQLFADRRTNPGDIPPFDFPYQGPYQTPFDVFPGAFGQTTGTVPGANVNMVNSNFHNPRLLRTNLSYEREIIPDWTLTTTYDYSFTTGNQRRRDLNLFPGRPDSVTGRIIYDRTQRPLPFASQVISRESTAIARYQALSVGLRKRLTSRFQLQGFYNYGRNFSDDDNENNCCSQEGYDQFDWTLDWSRSRLDVRHNFTFNGFFELAAGIELSPIVRAQSGRPFNATTGSDSPTAFALSATALENFRRYIGDPNAVVYGGGNGDGTSGTDRPIINGKLLERNAFEQPGIFQTDLRVARRFRFAQSQDLQLILDIFNVFDNANKFTTDTSISSPSFGALNNVDAPFAVQFGVRYSW